MYLMAGKSSSSTKCEKKKKGPSKKGPQFEREMAKYISLWASEGKHDDWLWRTSGSGARAKTRAKQGKTTANACGDLKAESYEALFLFKNCTWELKNGYKNWCILDVIDVKESKKTGKRKLQTFEEFALQAREDANNAGVKYPILLTKKDKRCAVIWLPGELIDDILLLSEKSEEAVPPMITFHGNENVDEYVGMKAENFFSWCSPQTFKTVIMGDKR